jgi:hypothetical protein
MRGVKYTAHVVIPLLVGGAIYVVGRSRALRMFTWFEALHLDGFVQSLRDSYGAQFATLPAWILFSLPDGAWVYSFALSMGLLWIDTNPRAALSLAAIGPALGIGGELGQLASIVPGTFDVTDLLVSSAAAIAAMLFLANERKLTDAFSAPCGKNPGYSSWSFNFRHARSGKRP